MKRVSKIAPLLFGVSLLFAGTAFATETTSTSTTGQIVTESANQGMGNEAAQQCIGQAESNSDYSSVSKIGMMGKYQFAEIGLREAGYANFDGADDQNVTSWSGKDGVNSLSDFLACGPCQENAKDIYDSRQLGYIKGEESIIGKSMNCNGTPTTITTPMVIQGAQFGHVAMSNYIASGGTCNAASSDGNNVCVAQWMCAASKCSTVTKDLSKQTCTVTMPMVSAISCANYTGQNLALCNYARPYLMTQQECDSAEIMAKAATKGRNNEKCENLSFGPGTGSWSFVLACSYAADVVADQDGVANNASTTGTPPVVPIDPNCAANLTAMGVQFIPNGTYASGTHNGVPCMVQDGVTVSNLAGVNLGGGMKVTCTMAKTMNTFVSQVKGLGVTGFYKPGSLYCRGITNNKGANQAKMSNHGLGTAWDFEGVYIGGRMVSMGHLGNPGTPDGAIAVQVKNMACATFPGVLTSLWSGYRGTGYIHFHVELQSNGCQDGSP